MSKWRKVAIGVTLVAVLVCGVVAFGASQAYSVFFDSDKADLRVFTATSEDIWKMDGGFDLEKWERDFCTGITITSLTKGEDLWIYFEYTGDLNQVFEHQNPILLPAGETIELKLKPLDNQNSPRVLNPSDIVNSEGKWRDFRGNIKVCALNKYATLETGEITVPGHALWEVLFAKKFNQDITQVQTAGDGKGPGKTVPEDEETRINDSREETPADIEVEALQDAKEADEYVREVASHKTLQFMNEVYQIIDKVAPGFLEEHTFLSRAVDGLVSMVNKLVRDIEWLVQELHRLQNEVDEQRYEIEQLTNALNAAWERITELENEKERLQGIIGARESCVPQQDGVSSGAGGTEVQQGAAGADIVPAPEQDGGGGSVASGDSGQSNGGEGQGNSEQGANEQGTNHGMGNNGTDATAAGQEARGSGN